MQINFRKLDAFAVAVIAVSGSLVYSSQTDPAKADSSLILPRPTASPVAPPCDPNMAKPPQNSDPSTNGPLVGQAVAASVSRPARDLPTPPKHIGPPREINPRNSIERDKVSPGTVKPCVGAGPISPSPKPTTKPRSRNRKRPK